MAFKGNPFRRKRSDQTSNVWQVGGLRINRALRIPIIIFGIIFFRIAPILTRKSRKVADNIGTDLQGVSPNDLIGGTIGLILGLVIAFLLWGVVSVLQAFGMVGAIIAVVFLIGCFIK